MQFSRDWLARYVALPPVAELAERLTAAGLTVDGVENAGDDVVLDLDVATNRPDCMNYLGLAREVAVLTGSVLELPEVEVEEDGERSADAVTVSLPDADCARYVARVVRGVKVGPSPEWLAARLLSIGQRPINNVVDVTNFVLWECGQPIHAFDLERLAGAAIEVRGARDGETLVTLDEESRELAPEVLVIADRERAVALAGVMGGLDSEVTAATSDVLIESAHFLPRRVRRGAGRLGLHTDASHRFERGTDVEICRWAADRVASLIQQVAGGRVLAGAVDVRHGEQETLSGSLDPARLAAFAGAAYGDDEIERILTGLGFETERRAGGFAVRVPSWRYYDMRDRRPDGEVYEADLFEEVMRVAGLDRIAADLPALGAPDEGSSAGHKLRDRVRGHLASCGLAEAITYAFHGAEAAGRFPTLGGGEAPVAIANPLSENLGVMRGSLLPNLVAVAHHNTRRGAEAVALFEVGHVFPAGGAEIEAVAMVLGGGSGRPWQRRPAAELFDLKGVVESLTESFHLAVEARPEALPGLTDGTACRLVDGDGATVGFLGRLDDEELAYPVFAAELAMDALAGAPAGLTVRAPSRFPAIAVDLTLTHRRDVPWSEIAAAIAAGEAPELASFGLKDRYEGKGVPDGAVNTTVTFVYNSDARSLTQDEVNASHERLSAALRERFGLSG